jgi:hypothetical protein
MTQATCPEEPPLVSANLATYRCASEAEELDVAVAFAGRGGGEQRRGVRLVNKEWGHQLQEWRIRQDLGGEALPRDFSTLEGHGV